MRPRPSSPNDPPPERLPATVRRRTHDHAPPFPGDIARTDRSPACPVLALAILALALLVGASSTLALAAEPDRATRERYARPAGIPFPPDNPYTPEKATLGKMLFFDRRLSRDRNVSCASCHSPSFGWEAPFPKAVGAGGQPLARHAQTVINLAWTTSFYWDGRAPSLEAQARGPMRSPASMDLPVATAVERLGRIDGYRRAFSRAFPDRGLTEDTLLAALATYERTLVTGDTPFDRWMRGDRDAVPDIAKTGFALFDGRAGCALCHSGWNFTDERFHDIGLPSEDVGREAVSGSPADRHAFRTPGLREIVYREPYMHDGGHASLEAVIAHYASGGIERPSRSDAMRPVSLDADDVRALIAFLGTLSSTAELSALPRLPAR